MTQDDKLVVPESSRTKPGEAGETGSIRPLPELDFCWQDVCFTKSGKKAPVQILKDVSGRVRSGEMLAIMGPSGAGKTSLLDCLAGRANGQTTGKIMLNGHTSYDRAQLTTYVEQDDALLGVLTVAETCSFAARLASPSPIGKHELDRLISDTLASVGLSHVAGNQIGTPIQRGLSGGQKRRTTLAASMVTRPAVLFLDEPTSGLDSTSSSEVLQAVRRACRAQGTIVIATIHQPSWESLSLFDNLLLLSSGKTMYNGEVSGLPDYLAELGHSLPPYANPVDLAMDLINTDFGTEDRNAAIAMTQLSQSRKIAHEEVPVTALPETTHGHRQTYLCQPLRTTGLLMQRQMVNYSRNILAYGIRLAMFAGMGAMLALIWIRLGTDSGKIQDRLSVSFFSVAFLSFMSVSGVPSFLEERSVFMRERGNGLYKSSHFVLATSIVTIPFIFACSLLFTIIIYFSIGLHPGAGHFFQWFALLFLAIYVAESQVLIISAAFPIFVVALALSAFLNGFWMAVQGYFILAKNLPRFWYYSFHFMDYENFAFSAMVKSDLEGVTFTCPGSIADGSCLCPYPSSLIPLGQCAVSGDDVLKSLQLDGISIRFYAAVLVIIIVIYRLLFWGALALRRR
ncbi:uncharacterized protein L969DRAFT_90390 [Mixia osmundae IAM 14324]|uniref:ABC transporter domain-containing protein n=1 Tax=Mixia osmundae (strain CBS 9802 / IAM 14324 / JCM 22182 / KY 12970) TaxID=764103 RepID=G7E2C2_MIXOS|nr:uncharacterized protein L969DRAFT_90390 [Mixia osmundae IAM 14324]KEI36854.1 hypothetical protein L969DRAFT_90390 [Mixia osmundae IAM 14324]GAA96982.1 hypothetical protein E5Q_03656 [Mixia osmundae IAM 14324]